MSNIRNNANVVSTCGQRLAALKKYAKTKTATKVSGELMKLSDLADVYQTAIDTRSALIPQRASFEKALSDRNSAEVSRQAADKKLKAWVVNEFGADSQEAQEFGFLPPKIGVVTVETKATAVAKSRATRAARGTMGKRQKEKIKGTLVAPAAPAVPAITAPAAAPAASALAATNGAPTSASPSNEVVASH